MKKVGLIGFGRFGKVLYEQVKDRVELQVFDLKQKTTAGPFAGLRSVCGNPLVVMAVPVRAIADAAQAMAPFLKPGTIVMDVCAVKEYPLRVMENTFGPEIRLLGSHPLFGPDSVGKSLAGHLMILIPHRIPAVDLAKVKKFWHSLGLRLEEMTAAQQDRLMAQTLALTHFLGRGLTGLPLPDTGISTRDYRNLLRLVEKINRDTAELFEDLHRYNPYTVEMRELLLKSFSELKTRLDKLQVVTNEHR